MRNRNYLNLLIISAIIASSALSRAAYAKWVCLNSVAITCWSPPNYTLCDEAARSWWTHHYAIYMAPLDQTGPGGPKNLVAPREVKLFGYNDAGDVWQEVGAAQFIEDRWLLTVTGGLYQFSLGDFYGWYPGYIGTEIMSISKSWQEGTEMRYHVPSTPYMFSMGGIDFSIAKLTYTNCSNFVPPGTNSP